MKNIAFILLDDFADWEAAYLAPALRCGVLPDRPGSYDVRYLTPGGRPVRSLGGLRAEADGAIEAGLPDDCAGVILVGGMGWQRPEAEAVAMLVDAARQHGLPVGAICNACAFLAAHGFLNTVAHTGNTVEQLCAWGGARYTGQEHFKECQAVADGGFVTANGSAALEFTRACLLALGADTPECIEASYRFNKEGFYAV